MLYICCCFCVDPHQLHIYNDCGFNFIFKRRKIMEKITFWLMTIKIVTSILCGITGVLFGAWLCNEMQNVGLSIQRAGESLVAGGVTALLGARARIEWLRRHALAVIWISGMVFTTDSLLVLTGNVWAILAMSVGVTAAVMVVHWTVVSNLIDNIFIGDNRTMLNNRLSGALMLSGAVGCAIGGLLNPDPITMGTIMLIESFIDLCLTLKVVKLMLNYLK